MGSLHEAADLLGLCRQWAVQRLLSAGEASLSPQALCHDDKGWNLADWEVLTPRIGSCTVNRTVWNSRPSRTSRGSFARNKYGRGKERCFYKVDITASFATPSAKGESAKNRDQSSISNSSEYLEGIHGNDILSRPWTQEAEPNRTRWMAFPNSARAVAGLIGCRTRSGCEPLTCAGARF